MPRAMPPAGPAARCGARGLASLLTPVLRVPFPGKANPSRCYRGTCDQRTPQGRGPEFDPSKGGDGDATFAKCAFIESMDHEVDVRACDQKVEDKMDPQLASFTEPPHRQYEGAKPDSSLPVGPQEEADISMEAARLVGRSVRSSQASQGQTLDHSD